MSAISAREHDLLAFFGKDPDILDAGVPWIYNILTYRQTTGAVSVTFEIAPSYKHLRLRISIPAQTIYQFDDDVEDVQYVETRDEQVLTIIPRQGRKLTLRVQPAILLSEEGARGGRELPPR